MIIDFLKLSSLIEFGTFLSLELMALSCSSYLGVCLVYLFWPSKR
uniref:Uncharacterized protein n=1 Tax=Myoviridae sp. ctByu2 TaxID=2827668 RepID=A0A8S5SA00_9CAUD|nr:MAG TPA: hypothetical protein [Myoviridae sp. ctByu2]